jgi:hypothetical protein
MGTFPSVLGHHKLCKTAIDFADCPYFMVKTTEEGGKYHSSLKINQVSIAF